MTQAGSTALGRLRMRSAVLLSPLEGVSDCAFRRLCYRLGAGFTWTEMIRAKAVARQNASTLDLIDTFDADVPTGLQLSVTDADSMLEALRVIERHANTDRPHFRHIRAVDLNFGCPSRDVIACGAGPALLKRRAKLAEVFRALRVWREHQTQLDIGAIGIKIRLGLNQGEQKRKVYLPVAQLAHDTPLDYIVVHARHAAQSSKEPATWSAIAEVRQHVSSRLCVIGNGDVRARADVDRMRSSTGCDAVMVARAAILNPWVFREMTEPVTPPASRPHPTPDEVDRAAQEYLHTAQQLRSKPKYIDFHRRNFARMLAEARGQPAARVPFPRSHG